MNREEHHKVTASHLQRLAYLYVRQSTLRQVLENSESTKRQYALRERAVALGLPRERVVVIDRDQGLSGADMELELPRFRGHLTMGSTSSRERSSHGEDEAPLPAGVPRRGGAPGAQQRPAAL